MRLSDLSALAAQLDGVAERVRRGLLDWRYHGRLVARQLDDTSLVIRTELDARPALLAASPDTFSVPSRFEKHMMVVADLDGGDADAIENALVAAWDLQQRAG